MRIVDVRLVVDRDDAVRVSIDGRPVALDRTDCPAIALAELARRVSGAAWRSQRTATEEINDERSALYNERNAS